MEVDDAAATTPEPQFSGEDTDESMDVTPEKTGGTGTAEVRHSGRRLLKAVKRVDEEELPDEEESPGKAEFKAGSSEAYSETCVIGTPLKLIASDEGEEGELSEGSLLEVKKGIKKSSKSRWDVKTPARRPFSKLPGTGSSINTVGTDTKKKRLYSLYRSVSDEYLLGFDEETGEPSVLLYDPDDELAAVAAAESPGSVSPQLKKKIKLSSSEPTSPQFSPQFSPHSQASPMNSPPHATPPPEATEATETVIKEEDLPLKQHVVADNEDNDELLPVVLSVENSSNSQELTPGTPISITKKPSSREDYYKKPFEHGWKRELVYRANMETSKDKADVYFISPGGKKLRTRNDIMPLLEGDLSIDHFSFVREPLGVGPDLEIVRSAKPTHRATIAAATLAAAAPAPSHPGKRISKPKGPKGASPPPQGWTPTRALKTNNAALLSSAGSSKYSGSPSTPPSSRSQSNSSKNKTKKPVQASAAEVENVTTSNMAGASHEPCTMSCAQARGQIPQLQCVKCLCLYHHECVGLNRQSCEYRTVGDMSPALAKDYVCESCVPQNTVTAPPIRTTTTTVSETIKTASTPLPSPATAKKATPSRQPATAAVENASSAQRANKLPQSIAVVKGKKYIMVNKPNVPKAVARATHAVSAEHLNDIENDLKQINDSMRKSRQPSSTSLDAAFQPNNIGAEVAQRSFATNFFANVSFAYDALLCILKYLKVHERPRAASVCKLWHLAAKDTSLWQTVRMKNSKISNWAGFAAALRRGETKHLDLRKMLFCSAKGDEMWADFSTYIGTVFSLESIDLCRCSAKVVESLFMSNQQLCVLNALAINDDSYSLENVDKLTGLKELRLRTCKLGTLEGDLMPLKTLTNLVHLSLTSLLGLGAKKVEVLGELVELHSLELGECGDFDSSFARAVLPKLAKLQRLRLENGTKTSCCTLEILDAVAKLDQLTQLEFVNFDIKPGFDEKLMLCTNIRKLLIIPTYISQSATTNQIVLYAVQQIADTLKVFTWGVTVELLRVTALYVDQCEESTKKEKHHFDECIPVMKPVPGAQSSDSHDEEIQDAGPNAVPQIEILPLDKVESILGDNLTTTKFTIVKMPYQATCKQQLVE